MTLKPPTRTASIKKVSEDICRKLYMNKGKDKKKGRMVYYCTNHSNPIHFVVEKFYVKDSLVSIRNYVFYDVKK